MLESLDLPHWPALLRPLADASLALGRLSQALDSTPLHQAWLWRETARSATKIAQFSGYRVRTERLCLALAGLPLDAADDDTGLAAARRFFLTATPLFRKTSRLDSTGGLPELFEPLWGGEAPQPEANRRQGDDRVGGDGHAGNEALRDGSLPRAGEGDQLMLLVRELAGFAGSGARPPLLDLFLDLRQHSTARRLPPSLARLALPLSLYQAGLVPRPAPGLLGGRLSLSTVATEQSSEREPVTSWLARGLTALAKEAFGSSKRLAELTRQHRAWHRHLAGAGLRGHSRLPLVLDLLAVTPVLSAGLVARHLGCSPQGAGEMLKRLSELGIVIEATPRARWKIYLAGDLTLADRDDGGEGELTPLSDLPSVDHEAIEASLDKLFADLEQKSARARARAGE